MLPNVKWWILLKDPWNKKQAESFVHSSTSLMMFRDLPGNDINYCNMVSFRLRVNLKKQRVVFNLIRRLQPGNVMKFQMQQDLEIRFHTTKKSAYMSIDPSSAVCFTLGLWAKLLRQWDGTVLKTTTGPQCSVIMLSHTWVPTSPYVSWGCFLTCGSFTPARAHSRALWPHTQNRLHHKA